MARLKPIPATIGTVVTVRYQTPEPKDRQASSLMMDGEEYEVFEETLRRWKAEGQRISWHQLKRAARLAKGEP